MAEIDKLYHKISRNIIEHGYEYKTDNRPQPCVQLSSINLDISLQEFPLLTTKKMFTKGIVEELLWFLRGDSHVSSLIQKGVNIWNQDGYNYYTKMYSKFPMDKPLLSFEEWFQKQLTTKPTYSGDVGMNYGAQWRTWTKHGEAKFDDLVSVDIVDQIQVLIDNLRKPNPINRRHIVTAWNPAELDQTALPPCHWAFEIIVRPLTNAMKIQYSGKDQEYLDTLWLEGFGKNNNEEAKATFIEETKHVPDFGFILKWHQRSVDTFLGLPFNIASYALLANIIGTLTGIQPLSIIGDLSNVHFYKPHIEVVEQQLLNDVNTHSGCQLSFSDNYIRQVDEFRLGQTNLDEFLSRISSEDFIFNNYNSYPALKGDMFAPVE